MTALQNSSSAMAVANNSLDETIALITAGTEIVQDASKVGNGLRTISMRIRGMNEETEELDDSLVNIKGDVYELTNGKVSIMEDPDTYKSTYQVLQEISKVWDELTDKQQAQLLDKLFGKTRAQIGASIISNFSQAEAAIKTMSESAGAADREMDIITNSLEYKINALKETFTGIWQNIFNREDLGGLVDFATGIAEVLDGITEKLGLFGSAIAAGGIAAGVMGLANAFKAFSAASGALTMVEALSGAFPGLSAAIGAFSTAMATTGGAAGVLHGALSGLWALIAAHPIIAAVGAVALLAVAFDKLHESAKEANDKMDASFQAYEDAKQKVIDVDTELKNVQASMDALEQKGSLTFIEQSQLEDLREAAELLQIQKDLAEKEEEKAAKQAASDAVNAYKKNFKDEISQEAYDEAIEYSSWSGNNAALFADEKNLSWYIAGIEKMKEFRDEEKKGSDEWNRYNDMVTEGTDIVWEQVGALTEYKQALESIPYELRTSEQNAVLDDINSSIEFVYEKLDPAKWKQIQFDSIFSHEAFKKAKQDMLDVALASDNLGISIEDVKNTLGDDLYGKLEKELSGKGFSMQDFVDNINSTAEIVDIDRVKENIKEGIETVTEEAASDTDTVEPEVEVEPKITVANNAEEKAKFDEWVDGLSDDYAIALQKLMGDQTIDTSSWDTSAYQAYIESLMTGSEEAADAVSDLTGTMQDLNIVFNDSTDNGLSKSISNYKDQMNTLISARDKWNNGELSVEEMATLQQSFVELNDFDMSNFGQGIEGAIDNVVGKFEEADTTFTDFKQNIIDKDDALKDALADISSITKKGFKDAEAGITEEYSESVNRIMDAASRAGLVNRNNRKEVDAFIDSLWESGIIQGKVGDITEKSTGLMGAFGKAIKSVGGEETIAGRALVTMRDNLLGIFNQTDTVTSAYSTLKDTLGVFTQYQSDASNALKASKSATGLTAEQVQTLTTAYQELDGFNPEALFEKTANGIHLNEEEFKRLNQEMQNSTLLQMYSDLGLKLDELHAAQARGEDTSGLEKDIADAQMLIAQYEGLTSALYAWQNAQSNGNERDSFESVAKGYEGMEKILNQGWYGDESLNTYLDLMLSASQRTGDAVSDFEKLGQTIEGTGHSLKDYFTFEDGNLVSDGLFDFLDDVSAKMGDSFASIDENGNYMFDFTGDKLQQVADAFGTSTEFIQLMERAMIDAGIAVEMSSSSYETLKETLEGLQSEGKISPDIDIGNLDLATASVDELQGVIDRLNEEKARIEVESDGSEETKQTLDTLDRTINSLTAQKVRTSIEVAIDNGKSIDELLALNDTQLAAYLNIDSSEVETAREQLESLQGTTESTTVTVKLDDSQFKELTNTNKTVTVTYETDTSAPDNYKPDDKSATVKYSKDSSVPDGYKPSNKSATVRYIANTSLLPTSFSTITRTVKYIKTSDGVGGVDGTAYAHGNWGTKSGGIALGGELGQELVIRDGKYFTIGDDSAEFFRYKPGDIIFNAAQTREIFEKGKITHGSGRGKALASGTAFDSGSGGRRRNTQTTSSGTSGSSSGSSRGSTRSGSSGSSSSGNTTSKTDDSDYFDYIEVKLDRIERKIERLKKSADDTFRSWSKRTASLNKEIEATTEELSVQQKAYEKYLQHASSVELSEDIKKLVREGTIDIKLYDGDTQEKIREYQQWYEKALDCKDAIQDLGLTLKDLYKQGFDNIVTKWTNALQNLQHAAERAEAIIDRRNSFASDYVTSDDARDASTENISTYVNLVKNAKQQRKKLENELSDLNNKLEEGLKNNTVTKWSEAYYELLKEIQGVENDIDDINKSIIGYSNSISEEYKNIFDSLSEDYENRLGLSEHLANQYNTAIEKAEAKGLLATEKYYEMLKAVENTRLSTLQEEYKTLKKAMDSALESGEIQKGSQAWYDMVKEINSVSESIQEAELNVLNLNKSIREVSWENFEFMEDQISELTDEAEFLIDLLKDAKMVDEKGAYTDEGLATMGLHGQNYNTLMLQADDYAEQIRQINRDIADDPSNTDLIKHKQELYDAQQKCILAANQEKQAIKSLVEDGIKNQLSSLKDLIKEYTNALDSEKELYDFQKKVNEQTNKIATLRKQLAAYENDLTEETRSKVQKIRVQIDEAQEELEETEYEKYIKDQKKLLDSLYDEYEKVMNERLDNIDFLIEEAIATINDNADIINRVITQAAADVGYTMSDEMRQVWEQNSDDNEKNIANRIAEFSKVLDQMVSTGAISKENANLIKSAIADGSEDNLKNGIKIIQGLVDNGKISHDNAVNLLSKLSASDSADVKNALNIIEQLKANGTIESGDALKILNGIVLQDSNSRKDALGIVSKLTANGTLASAQATDIISGLADNMTQESKDATSIITNLLANGKITQDEAAKILNGIVSDKELDDLYARDAVKRLQAIGVISDNEAEKINNAIGASTGKNSVLGTYSENFSAKLTTLNNTVSKIKEYCEALVKAAQAEAETRANEIQEQYQEVVEPTTTTTTKKNTKDDAKQATTTTKKVTTTTTTKKKTTTTTNKVTTTTTKKAVTLTEDIKKHVAAAIWNGNYGWGNDPNRSGMLEEVFGKNNGIQAIVNKGYDYTANLDPKGYSYLEMRKKFKGYSSGIKRSPINELAWTNENWNKLGGETIIRTSDRAVLTRVGSDDRIYNAMASGNLWEMANNPSRFIAKNSPNYLSSTRSNNSYENNVSMGDINLNFPSVRNYEELVTAMQKDKKFEKMIQNMTLGATMGRNNKDTIHWK